MIRDNVRHLLHPAVPKGFCAAFYKGTHPFPRSIYTEFAKLCDGSIYCHGELVFSDGWSGSSTLMDKPSGVRLKKIYYSKGRDGWDFVPVDPALEPFARQWYEMHAGSGYDLVGQLRFLSGIFSYVNSPKKWFCTESMAAALQHKNPGRYGPGDLSENISDFRVPKALDLEKIFPNFQPKNNRK